MLVIRMCIAVDLSRFFTSLYSLSSIIKFMDADLVLFFLY